ncbi:hypothetical protein ACRZXV_003133 [Serratia liquefaciens]
MLGFSSIVKNADYREGAISYSPPVSNAGLAYLNLFERGQAGLTTNWAQGMPKGAVTGTPVIQDRSVLFRFKQNYIDTLVPQTYEMQFVALVKSARTLATPRVGREFILSNYLSNGPDGGSEGFSIYFDNQTDTSHSVVISLRTTSGVQQRSFGIPITGKPVLVMGGYSSATRKIRLVCGTSKFEFDFPNASATVKRGGTIQLGTIGERTGDPGAVELEVFIAGVWQRKFTKEEEDTFTAYGDFFLKRIGRY